MTYCYHKGASTICNNMTEPFHSTGPDSCLNGLLRNNTTMTLSDRLYRDVAGMIIDGSFAVGQRLPSVRDMAQRRSVSRDTVLRAYDRLVSSGRAHVVRGSGYFVAERVSPPSPIVSIDERHPQDPTRLLHSDFSLDHQPGSGILRHGAAAQVEVARVLRSVVASGFGLDSGYGDPLGYLPLRQQFQSGLRQGGVDCAIDNIVTVPGATAGISLAVRALLRAGSVALVEDPCSFIHMNTLMAQGAEIRRVPRLVDGPDMDVLRELCERYRPKLFVLSSLLHNPTGTTITLHKAQTLIEMAAEFGMVLIDDCSYADLLPRTENQSMVPLILLDRLRWVIHITGFSRTVSPAIGSGYVVAGEAHMRYIRAYRPVAGLGNMIVAERSVYRLLNEGSYRRRCERIRASLACQMVALRQHIASIGLPLPSSRPGMFLWLPLGENVEAAAVGTRMSVRGFLTAPAKHFTPLQNAQSYMRFNVTTTSGDAVTALSACL